MSIVVGAGAALALVGTAGAVTWHSTNEGRHVGTWQVAAASARTPKAARPAPAVTREPTAGPSTDTASGSPSATAPVADDGETGPNVPESATVERGDGTQKVGELVQLAKPLGYGAPEREVLHYPGASYVKVHFDRMTMAPGDYLTVSDSAGEESYRYDAQPDDQWAMSITGDTAVVEMHRGEGAVTDDLGVQVDQVARGYSRTEQARVPSESLERPGLTGREESVCGDDTSTDAVCYKTTDPVAYTRSKAIARLLINGTELCTGWRIGTSNRMLTNNHCFASTVGAKATEVWFNYQCAKCGGYEVIKPTKVQGAKVLASEHVLDFTLFTVDNFAAIQKFGYLSLDPVRPVKNQQLYVPQHPAGEPARIAGRLGDKAGTCSVVDPSFTGYGQNSDVSYLCDTEGGSSGSPVLSRKTNKVVALHHFGGCPNSGIRADLLNAKIKSLL